MLRAGWLIFLVALVLSGCATRDGVETSFAFMVIIGTMLCKFSDPEDNASRA